jgi:hypothetical protein
MSKEKIEALMATTRRFTNLLNGDIIPNVGVISIISYYEDLLHKNVQVVKSTSNIERKFQEEEINELSEYDYWDGDESDNFLQ